MLLVLLDRIACEIISNLRALLPFLVLKVLIIDLVGVKWKFLNRKLSNTLDAYGQLLWWIWRRWLILLELLLIGRHVFIIGTLITFPLKALILTPRGVLEAGLSFVPAYLWQVLTLDDCHNSLRHLHVLLMGICYTGVLCLFHLRDWFIKTFTGIIQICWSRLLLLELPQYFRRIRSEHLSSLKIINDMVHSAWRSGSL